jgi:ribosome-associated protein
MEGIEKARLCAKYAGDKKAEGIVIMDARGVSPITDYFVICTASSSPHLRAVRDEIADRLHEEHRIKPLVSDGSFESQWLILHYGDVMVHVMQDEKRGYYALEDLWGDAPRVKLTDDVAPSEETKSDKAVKARKAREKVVKEPETMKRKPKRKAAAAVTSKKRAAKTTTKKKR